MEYVKFDEIGVICLIGTHISFVLGNVASFWSWRRCFDATFATCEPPPNKTRCHATRLPSARKRRKCARINHKHKWSNGITRSARIEKNSNFKRPRMNSYNIIILLLYKTERFINIKNTIRESSTVFKNYI